MMKKALACTMFVGVVFSLPAAADDASLKFNGGIGVIPVSSVSVTGSTVTVTPNIVRGVSPAGQIWVIADLDAKVSANGSITVKGQGLIFGGGDNAGRASTATTAVSVLATLICQPPPGPFTESSTSSAGVLLSPNGDFEINDTLKPVPTFPCASPMLLIRNATNLHWFAVGIPSSGQ